MDELPNVSEFSTETLTITDLFIGNDIRSPFYRKIIGFFTYQENHYKFLYDQNHQNITEFHLKQAFCITSRRTLPDPGGVLFFFLKTFSFLIIL